MKSENDRIEDVEKARIHLTSSEDLKFNKPPQEMPNLVVSYEYKGEKEDNFHTIKE